MSDCSMDERVSAASKEFEHALPRQMCHAPSRVWLQSPACAEGDSASGELDPDEARRAQKATGNFLFSAGAVDSTLLHAPNELACDAAEGTEKRSEAAMRLLGCVAVPSQA